MNVVPAGGFTPSDSSLEAIRAMVCVIESDVFDRI